MNFGGFDDDDFGGINMESMFAGMGGGSSTTFSSSSFGGMGGGSRSVSTSTVFK